MAHSQPTEKAQSQAVCQFCEESFDLRWKCINCDVLMCQLCVSKIHSKIKLSEEHEMLNLKDCKGEDAAQKIRKVDLQNMPCIDHGGQKYCAFCIHCDKLACMDCIIELHQNHEYRKLNEVYDTINAEMKALQNHFQSCFTFLSNEKEKLQRLLKSGDKNFKETKQKIRLAEKEMIETIKKCANELVQELKSMWRPIESKIQSELSVIQKKNDDLTTRKESLKNILQSHKASDIFSKGKILDKTLPTREQETINLVIVDTNFISRNILNNISTRKHFGELYSIPNIELKETFQSDLPTASDILNFDRNTTFISCRKTSRLQKVRFEKNNIKVEECVNVYVYDTTRLRESEVVVSTGESELYVYSKDKTFKTYKSFFPLKTTSVYVSKNCKMYVGLIDSFTYPNKSDSVRRVVVLNIDSDEQNTYEFDKNNKRMFTRPRRIITLNDKIYVIDTINENGEGRVMVLDDRGQLLSIYYGCRSQLDTAKFYPSDIIVTPTGIVLVSDQINHYFHLLTSAMEVIAFKNVRVLGIEFPLSLDFDKDGILWIGCNPKKTAVNAQIFAVRLI